ncbi:unnamed protein product [Hydatigera taeniaeformis]|uniref:SERPIN domain-containing protein n=1 Tax=Hydatigena taeniaeformis TaxID=6205 RepID=A0A0R3WY50_HYDTA|nr:unnamed protein product [Hydatigera taeniaeformis]
MLTKVFTVSAHPDLVETDARRTLMSAATIRGEAFFLMPTPYLLPAMCLLSAAAAAAACGDDDDAMLTSAKVGNFEVGFLGL